jgi:hypothetical protein
MGKTFPIIPLKPEVSDWLVSIGVLNKPLRCESRYPTVQELMISIKSLENIKIEIDYFEPQNRYTQINIVEDNVQEASRWAKIIISEFSPKKPNNQYVEFYFYRAGQEKIVNEIMEAVVDICGPLVLLRDYDNPEVFYPKWF